MLVQSRTRYNCWDLLADIGGFYDGLLLLASLLVGSFSALAFKADYVDGMAYDGHDEDSGTNFASGKSKVHHMGSSKANREQ